MTLLQIYEKIGKQPLRAMRKTNAKVLIDGKEYVITNVEYQNGKWLHMNVESLLNCKHCKNYWKYNGGEYPPHTCDICTSLDTEDYYMFEEK